MSLQVSHFVSFVFLFLSEALTANCRPGEPATPVCKTYGDVQFVGKLTELNPQCKRPSNLECVSGAVEVKLSDFRSENPSGEFLLFRNFVNCNYVNNIETTYEWSHVNLK